MFGCDISACAGKIRLKIQSRARAKSKVMMVCASVLLCSRSIDKETSNSGNLSGARFLRNFNRVRAGASIVAGKLHICYMRVTQGMKDVREMKDMRDIQGMKDV